MLVCFVDYCECLYLRTSTFTDIGSLFPMEFATKQNELIFIGIGFLLPNCAYTNSKRR